MTELPIEAARDLAVTILRNHRLTEEDAGIVADHLIDAQLTGYTFAGLPRLLVVLERLRAQDRTPEPIEVMRESPVSATVNGRGNLGYVVCRRAVDIAIAKAETTGLAVVGAYDSYYSGRSGYYVERAARRGMVAIHASSAFPMVAPTGGTRPVLGSNPITMAFPAGADSGEDPVIADLSTASSTWGALQLAKRVGEPLPDGIAIDAHGAPTTDPAEALLGAILPSAGHKGYAIAVAVQALGLFAGGDAVPEPFGNFGFFFLVMKRDLFVDEQTYQLRMADMIRAIEDAGSGSVVLPGRRSAQRRRAALARGVVEIPERVHQDLLALLDT